MLAARAKLPRRRRATRNWTNLGDGPANLIAELALASDVANYVRFRAVCQSWRRWSKDPRAGGLDARFLPRQWIMLQKSPAGPRPHSFLNLSTGECVQMDLPELAGHALLAVTPEGLLLLLHEPTLVVRLLNPFTHQLTDLPPVTALLTPKQHQSRRYGLETGLIAVSGVGLYADGSTLSVAVSFHDPVVLAVAKPGDKSWTVVDDACYIHSTLPFGGRLYYAHGRGVMVLNTGSKEDDQAPRPQTVADMSWLFYLSKMVHSHHLVDNGGVLMLVRRMLRWHDDDRKFHSEYDAYKVDLEVGVLIPAKGFDGRAVLLGMYRAVSVSADASFLSVDADTIYLGKDCDPQDQTYHIADGKRSDWVLDRVVDCLRQCIQGIGNRLA